MKIKTFNDLVGQKALMVRHNFDSGNTYKYDGVVTSIADQGENWAVVKMEFKLDEERVFDYCITATPRDLLHQNTPKDVFLTKYDITSVIIIND